MPTKLRTAIELLICLVICFLPAVIGGRFAPGAWYASLAKPALNPPGWVFGPVWTVLYALMGIALFLIWQRRGAPGWALAVTVFAIQLVLNAAWSWLFFGMQRPDLAFIEICAMWVFIALSIVAFWRLRPLAGGLLLPYAAWVAFAAWLNLQLWRLNPTA
jgi:tryptophan-rich sensory protein